MVGVTIADPRTALKASVAALIAGQVLFPDVNGNIVQDSNLFWNNTAKKLAIVNLTAGQVLFPDSSGNLTQDSNLFWDNTNKRLGIGTVPSQTLEIDGGHFQIKSGNFLLLRNASNNNSGVIYNTGASNNSVITFQTSSTDRLYITQGGNVGITTGGTPSSPTHVLQLINSDDAAKTSTNTWTVTSDKRLKKNITPFIDGLAVLLQLNPINFQFTGDGGTPKDAQGIGLVAQDVEAAIPYCIRKTKGKIKETDVAETDIYKMNNHALVYILVNAVKELSSRLEIAESKLKKAGL